MVNSLPPAPVLSSTDDKDPTMVLDGKSVGGHNQYGSIGPGEEASERPPSPQPDTEADSPTDKRVTSMSTVSGDVYQRQPLLAGGGQEWGDVPPLAEEDPDPGSTDKRSLHAHNGIVRIDMSGAHREEPRFPKEKWKTFIAFLVLVVNFIITTGSLAVVHEKVPNRDKVGPLPDTLLDNLPFYPKALDISEVIIMISTNVTFFVILLHRHRYIIFRRVCLMLSLLYLMRSVTMYVTVLPMSSTTYYCSPKANSTSPLLVAKRVFQLISGFGLSINGKHTFCGDYIYSGHTVILCMAYLIIKEYTPKRMSIIHWVSWLASFTGIVLVLMARGHYTIDVLIAYYATTRTFWIYHTLANYPYLKQASPNNMLSRIWWFKAFQYFEGNVGGVVPCKFNWPLPWPRKFHAKHPNRDS